MCFHETYLPKLVIVTFPGTACHIQDTGWENRFRNVLRTVAFWVVLHATLQPGLGKSQCSGGSRAQFPVILMIKQVMQEVFCDDIQSAIQSRQEREGGR